MIILSHRGYWLNADEKNTAEAFHRSFSLGFGTETDLRDYNGEIVISHDIAGPEALKLDDFFKIYVSYKQDLPLALNVKADGIQDILLKKLSEYQIKNYFLFDMSIPDHLQSLKRELATFTRQSEYEKECALYSESKGVWMDEFKSHWITAEFIYYHVNNDKKVCIVSPDLHKREYLAEWKEYKNYDTRLTAEVMICTDFPEKAKEFFNED